MIQASDLEYPLKGIYRASSALSGLVIVLDTMLEAEGHENAWPLRGNDYVKGALLAGIDVATQFIDVQLERLEKRLGIPLA